MKAAVFADFESFYRTDLQSLYALCLLPAAFLAWLAWRGPTSYAGIEPSASRFMRAYAIVFALETMLDPVATGPLLRWLDAESRASWVMLPFVLLGDFRVFLLLFFVAEPGRGLPDAVGRAAAWTLVVPLVAGSTYAFLGSAVGALPGQTLWILYEIAFLAMARGLRQSWLPRRVVPERADVRRYLGMVLDFVALYYALWVAADAMILFAGLDEGWGLRLIPNQLYYGLWVPLVYALFFHGSPSRSRSVPTRSAAAAR